MNHKQSIDVSFKKKSDKKKANYLVRIKESLTTIKYLIRGGLAFRGHYESDDSSYKGNFLELLEILGLNNEEIGKVVLQKYPKNHKMTSPDIQKDLVNACAVESVNKIVKEIGDNTFSVLVDESGDSVGKEQMAVVVCFVDDKGFVLEIFIGIVHVKEDLMFIMSSNKCQDLLREHQKTHVTNLIDGGFVETGRGLNQELALVKPGDTRWGSYYKTLTSLMNLFSPIIEILRDLEYGSSDKDGEAKTLLIVMQTFDFLFMFHLMVDVLGVKNNLSQALQRGDQDILNALELVSISKKRLQEMRTDHWDDFLDRVVSSYKNVNVNVPDMEEQYLRRNRSVCLAHIVSNLHHYKFDCFMNILDVQLKELNDRFNMESADLLHFIACLSPCSSFEAFDSKSLLKMARMYLNEFSDIDDQTLANQFQCYIRRVKEDDRFSNLKVSTASVERVFSGLNFVKNELRNRMGDPWLNYSLVTYVERDVFTTISDATIINLFQAMNKRKVQVELDE